MFSSSLARGVALAVLVAPAIGLAQSAAPLPTAPPAAAPAPPAPVVAAPSGAPAPSAATHSADDQRIRALQSQLGITEARMHSSRSAPDPSRR